MYAVHHLLESGYDRCVYWISLLCDVETHIFQFLASFELCFPFYSSVAVMFVSILYELLRVQCIVSGSVFYDTRAIS